MIACGTQTLHQSQGGIRARRIDASPYAYARELARYIRDASTIRARTMNEWGRAPSIEECREIIAKAQAKRDAFKAESDKLVPTEQDEDVFAVPVIAQQVKRDRRVVVKVDFSAPALPRSFDPATLTARDVIVHVARAFYVKAEDMLGPGRARPLVIPRQVAMYALHKRGGMSLTAIARMFGRDHSTAIHAIRQFEAKADDRMITVAARMVPGGLA